jgi:hypothetical protein
MSTELQEALTAAGAAPFVPKIIDPVLFEAQRRYSPALTAIPAEQWGADVYNFNTRNTVATGGFTTDGGSQPVSTSAYQQSSFTMKHLQTVGAVTGYATEVTKSLTNLQQTEVSGAIRGLIWDAETAVMWGNAASTYAGPAPQFDGLDTQVNTYSGMYQNALDKAGNTISFSILDEIIDLAETQAAMPVEQSPWGLFMSSTMVSKISQLATAQQRFLGSQQIALGLNVPTYRDVPLIKSSFLSARSLVMGAVTATPSTTGGTLAAGTYYYRVSPVIARQGELIPSTEISATTTGTTSSVALSFATPTGVDGALPMLFKVWRGTTAGGESLLGYVDAKVALAADGVTPIYAATITDTGTYLLPSNGATVPATVPAGYFGTNAGMLPGATQLENIYLMSLDKDNVVRPYVRWLQPLNVAPTVQSPDTLPFAVVADTCLAVRGSRFFARASRVAASL